MKQKFVLLWGLAVPAIFMANGEKNCYFNTVFLSNYDKVKRHLVKHDGFINGFLTTHDALKINYLWLKRSYARYTVIFSGGFWPGRKEGLATFYKIFPEDCNLLFFDARGHGGSEGSLLQSMWRYGTYEPQDVMAAIAWVHAQTELPIIVFGLCAGAFHSTHALLKMHRQHILAQHQVKALIFDSGWRSPTEVSETTFPSEWRKRVRKQTAQMPLLIRVAAEKTVGWPVAKSLEFFIRWGISPWYWRHDRSINLSKKIGQLPIPILYIHSLDDTYAHIGPIKALARNSQQSSTWWIKEPSGHAIHHLKHTVQYRATLKSFLSQII